MIYTCRAVCVSIFYFSGLCNLPNSPIIKLFTHNLIPINFIIIIAIMNVSDLDFCIENYSFSGAYHVRHIQVQSMEQTKSCYSLFLTFFTKFFVVSLHFSLFFVLCVLFVINFYVCKLGLCVIVQGCCCCFLLLHLSDLFCQHYLH